MDLLIFVILIIFTKSFEATNTVEFIERYEVVNVKIRSHNYHNALRVNEETQVLFTAYGTNFSLYLYKDKKLFGNTKVYVKRDNKTFVKLINEISTDLIYEGSVKGGNSSYAFGYFTDDVFTGTIKYKDEIYYTESASKYLGDILEENKILIYKETDVRDPGCEVEDGKKICHKRIDEVQKIIYNYSSYNFLKNNKRGKVCGLELISDHTYFQHMNMDIKKTIKNMFYHVKAADTIFRNTDFNDDEKPDGVGFFIKKITIFADSDRKDYILADMSNSSYKFLEDLSLYVQIQCLVICFTYREFTDNVIGMAYRANKELNSVGGICQTPLILEDHRIHSLNVAFISSYSSKRQLPDRIINHALTHEVGHSFGSPHDDSTDPICSPGHRMGNYIMNEFTNDGTMPNNVLFSPCSRKAIYGVLKTKSFCMISYAGSFCGNGIVEEGEECDCGTTATCDDIDPCCTPMYGMGGDKECTLRRKKGSKCSPRESTCCNASCQIIPRNSSERCNTNNPCHLESLCTGDSQLCPPIIHVTDGTPCLETYLLCNSGECNSSICDIHNLEMCNCPIGSNRECHICCRDNNDGTCKPASEFGFFTSSGKLYLKLKGSYCDFTRNSICDDMGQCVTRYEYKDINKISFFFWIRKYWPHVMTSSLLLVCLSFFMWHALYPLKNEAASKANLVNVDQSKSEEKPYTVS